MEGRGALDSQGRDGQDETGGEQPDNVVRLPREWIGPLDELIPIGPRAGRLAGAAERPPAPVASLTTVRERAKNAEYERTRDGQSGAVDRTRGGQGGAVARARDGESDRASGQPDGDPPSQGAERPLTADAFWGADSRALHQVVQPALGSAPPGVGDAPTASPAVSARQPASADSGAWGRSVHSPRALIALAATATLAAGLMLALTLSSGTHGRPLADVRPAAVDHRPGRPAARRIRRDGGGAAGRHRAGSGRGRPVGRTTQPSTIREAGTGGSAGSTFTAAAKSASTTTAASTDEVGSTRSGGVSSARVMPASGLPAPGGIPPP